MAKDIHGVRTLEETAKGERRRLLDFIRGRVRNESDAEDIVQEVFYQLAQSYSVTEPIERMTAWLFTVARNRIIDWYRRRRGVNLNIDDGSEEERLNIQGMMVDSGEDPERAYWRSMVWDALAEALDDLPEEQRDVFVWHEMEGRSFKEIAAMTGEPISTLLSRKRYAVLALREALRELYDEL